MLVTLHEDTIEDLDNLAEEVDEDRSEIVETILVDALGNDKKIDDLFGVLETEEDNEEED